MSVISTSMVHLVFGSLNSLSSSNSGGVHPSFGFMLACFMFIGFNHVRAKNRYLASCECITRLRTSTSTLKICLFYVASL
jgi:hypothetical protein